jgi:hypothetical protein
MLKPWEVYVVKTDADTLTKQADSACCASPSQAADGVISEQESTDTGQSIEARTAACC